MINKLPFAKFLPAAGAVLFLGGSWFVNREAPNQLAPQHVAAPVENDGALLDYLEESGEIVRGLDKRLQTIEAVAIPNAAQQEARQKTLVEMLGEFRSYEAQAQALYDQVLLSMAFQIFNEAEKNARANNKSIEWELAAKADHLTDQLFALAKVHAGYIPMEDGADRDKFSDVLIESQAMARLLGQIMAGRTPAYSQVDSGLLVQASKGLANQIYASASQGLPLGAMANLPEVQPEVTPVSYEEGGGYGEE